MIYEKNGGAFLKKLLHYFVINVLIFIRPALTYRLCSSQIGNIDAQVNHIDIVLNNTAAHGITSLCGRIVVSRCEKMFLNLAVQGIEIFFHFFLDVRGKVFGKIFQSVFSLGGQSIVTAVGL